MQTYDHVVIPALVSSMREFFSVKPTLEVVIAATIRNEQTFQTFIKACSGSLHKYMMLSCLVRCY